MGLFSNFHKSVGIDLGTANFLVYLKGEGIIVNEPSLVALNTRTNQVLAIGNEARKMLDRTPSHVSLIKPLVNGVISDFETTSELLKYFLRQRGGASFLYRYKLGAISIPTDLTEVERKSVEDAAHSAGVSRVLLVEEPIASAIGIRLPVEEAAANMIINIGGGTTELSIISVGGAVVSRSIKIAGERLNEDIMRYIKNEHKLLIGEPSAETLKIMIGSATPLEERLEMPIRGRDLPSGLPKEVVIKNTQIRTAITRSLKSIVEMTKKLLEDSPPELVGDVYERGIYLTGGGALLRGIDKYLEKELAVHVNLVDDPLTCVVRGLGIIIEDLPRYSTILSNQQKPRLVNL